MAIFFKSFSVVFCKFNHYHVMATAGSGAGGKGDGQGGGWSGKGHGQGGGREVVWPAEDYRNTKPGVARKPVTRNKTRKPVKCRNCGDLCCSLARELVCEAFKLGVVDMSRKVSSCHI